jgi:hypothetical protein
MSPEPNAVEQAVARALRDNLAGIQRSGVELQQAINDVVAACSSSKPTNALPPLLRAQACAASLSAALEVLARFTALALQPGPRSPLEAAITQAIAVQAPEAPPAPVRPIPEVPAPQAAAPAPPVPLEPPVRDFAPTEPPSFPVELEAADETLSAGELLRNRSFTGVQIAWPKFPCRILKCCDRNRSDWAASTKISALG